MVGAKRHGAFYTSFVTFSCTAGEAEICARGTLRATYGGHGVGPAGIQQETWLIDDDERHFLDLRLKRQQRELCNRWISVPSEIHVQL